MLNRILNYFEDPEDNDPSFIRLVRNILVFVMLTTAGLLILATGIIVGAYSLPSIVALSITLILEVISFIYTLRGKVGIAKFIIPLALLIVITYLAATGLGLRDTTVYAYPSLIVISALLLKVKARYIMTPLVIFATVLVALADMTGFNASPFAASVGVPQVLTVCVLFLATSEILQLLVGRLNENIVKAQKNEQAQITANLKLRELQVTLEDRVTSRTTDLELANQSNEKRARQFEAIAQVARATTANQNLETLLPNLVELVSNQFGFYHTGIFLIDQNRAFAELRAANSEGGKRMVARGHKLGVGQSGIVGFVSATGNPRIALDVEADAAFFNNPDLPSTRSEMALPLRVSDQVIGVLDVQSIVSNAFQEEDIDILSTLADQVSIAIQNSQSYETTQGLLKEAQRTSGAFLRESWRILQTQEANAIGYQVTDNKLQALTKPLSSAQIKKAMSSRETVTENGAQATLAIPIRLRDEVIGVMDIRVPDDHDWDADEIDVAEAVAERLALALEASLLLKSTQRQAEIERITADISGKLGSTTQFNAILRTAAEELSRVLGGSDVLVQLQSEIQEEHLEA